MRSSQLKGVKMGIEITVYGGAGEIGGNKILLKADGTSIFLDFGTSFGKRSLFYEEFLTPRGVRGLLDPLVMGLLPPLKGIYRQDFKPPGEDVWKHVSARCPVKELTVDGVFLSHAHIDHTGYVSFFDPQIPIYSGLMTAVVTKAIQDSAASSFESEVCYAVPREPSGSCLKSTHYQRCEARQRPFNILGDDALSPEIMEFWKHTPGARGLDSLPLLRSNTIKHLNVKAFPVDHSLFGATALAVETSDGWIVYTGDIRLHGARGDLTEKFIEAVAQLKPHALICEGTNAGETKPTSEEEVFCNSLTAVKNAAGLVVADFGPRNIERLLIFRRIAEETGRKLVLLPKDVYLLESMRLVDRLISDFSTDPVCLIYNEVKTSAGKWEENLKLKHAGKMVSPGEIRQDQSSYILCMSFWDLSELPDLEPRPGSIYIHSTCEAFNEEMAISYERLKTWLDYFGVALVGGEGFHASGHIVGSQMLDLIRTVKPKYLIPVHTHAPEFFADNLEGEVKVILPEESQSIRL